MGATGEVWKSADGGLSWSSVFQVPDKWGGYNLAVTANGKVYIVFNYGGSGIYTSAVSFLPSGLDWSIEEEETGVILVCLPELKPGESYSYILIAPGYEEMAGVLAATTGVMHRVDLILKKETMSAVPSASHVKVS